MRSLLFAAALLCACTVQAQSSGSAETPYVFRAETAEVSVLFTASDPAGHPVASIAPQDVVVREDDTIMPVVSLRRMTDAPVRFDLLVDVSGSVEKTYGQSVAGIVTFLRASLRPHDSVVAAAFTDHAIDVAYREPLQFAAALSSLHPGGLTSIYDVVCDRVQQHGAQRQMMVIISDGDDSNSARTLEDAIASAQARNTPIYAITLRGKRGSATGEQVLRKLADTTGGRAFVVRNAKELDAALRSMAADASMQFELRYRARTHVRDGFHAITLEARNSGLRLRGRTGYFSRLRRELAANTVRP